MSGITVRDGMEIQRAHDILKAVFTEEAPFSTEGADEVMIASIHSALDTLCWVLGHSHNKTFAANLKRIEQALEDKGYVLRQGQRPDTPMN
jgi:hypothetical protein